MLLFCPEISSLTSFLSPYRRLCLPGAPNLGQTGNQSHYSAPRAAMPRCRQNRCSSHKSRTGDRCCSSKPRSEGEPLFRQPGVESESLEALALQGPLVFITPLHHISPNLVPQRLPEFEEVAENWTEVQAGPPPQTLYGALSCPQSGIYSLPSLHPNLV
ncbi:hypothetical protein P7K49_000888 [Saguinus oedipus]|uniref:Uncharacterized protein n=1 Tax=Saguinus oedipus TaxID=9490 RepID=A0ABQ9WCZ7_SAGOE|nr:hypothetical protein P7K49_000888 [Saguinus oedipus]